MKLPYGWHVVTLDEICSSDLQTGPFGSQLHANEYVAEGVAVIMPKDIIGGRVFADTAARITPERAQRLRRHKLQAGDVIFSRRGDVARAGLVCETDEGFLCGTGCLRARPNQNRVFPPYLNLLVQSTESKRWLENNAVGQTMLNMNTDIISQLTFKLPPIREQRSISTITSTWDAAIQKTKKLIAAKERLLYRLREGQFQRTESAKRTKLHTVTYESTARNGAVLGRKAVMAVTKQYGMRPMREETIAANIERYKVVRPRAFAYNPMRLNIGSIAMSRFATDILVSPDYVVFECDESKLLPGYLNHLRFCRRWTSHFQSAGNGSVRIRIYYDDLGAFTIDLPSLDAQRQIVMTLDAAVLELEKQEAYAEALKVQKRGLMQKLLTGEWRLPIPTTSQGLSVVEEEN